MSAATSPPAAEAKASGGASGATALMRQYREVKARYPDAIVFFRLGDFYEMFDEDAVYASRALGLTLTTRDKGKEEPIPMCGVPHHAARAYLAKLTDLGHRVALCEQLDDPKMVRGLVKRDVVRLVTPGVILDEETLDPRAPNYVAAVLGDARAGYGLAVLDVTTGDFRATEAANLEALVDELARVEPREVLLTRDEPLAPVLRRAYPRLAQTFVAPGDGEAATKVSAALGAGWDPTLAQRYPLAVRAAARALDYARATQVSAPLPLGRLEVFTRDEFLVIDEPARAHLELCETMFERRRQGSLLDVIDVTKSSMGARLLRRWLLFPLRDVSAIRARHAAVERLVGEHAARDQVRRQLSELADLERLAGRARLGVASPRDIAAVGRTLMALPALAESLRAARAPSLLPAEPAPGEDPLELAGDLQAPLADEIVRLLRPDAGHATKEGGYINAGVSPELDELREIAAGGRDRIAAIERRERERTGIASLKVKFNSVFGYYIEVSRAQLANVPADYTRKQTVANAERFVTPELGEYEAKILNADERRVALELELFVALRERVGRAVTELLSLAVQVARVDALAALAEVAHRNGYARPEMTTDDCLHLVDSRHPVVERWAAGEGGFVPNDIHLDGAEEQLLLITGPNMAGKSTVIRQTALAVVLAQMGSFVPARSARIGVVDRVFTRVGAGDNLARGESTFLVEMRETAHILRNATRKSLVVLDEIGRGTSTYDGVSIAWAVAEHLHDAIGARTLFATHYHELGALADTHPRVRNYSVAAREWNGEVVFLRKLTPGGASRSFGIEVARLAGVPAPVVTRAQDLLRRLEGLASGRAPGAQPTARLEAPDATDSPQLSLWGASAVVPLASPSAASPDAVAPPQASAARVLDELRALPLDELSPRAAWETLASLQKKLTDPAAGPS